jgi:hypothetical protein
MYRDRDGSHLVGSNDGVHFDWSNDRHIQHLHSDTQNAIVYDLRDDKYLMFCRAKSLYRAGGEEMINIGESRRIARVENKELWADCSPHAANILLPDELDTRERYHAFYGMPTTIHGGVYYGFLWPFRWNDRIHTELAWSRDGIHFERHPLRPKLIDYGPARSWDDEMVFASSWVEVGDVWHIYYAGWDGPHNTRERNGGIGLATVRREGFVSLRGPTDGGVACTRTLRWPGGRLVVNYACSGMGQLTVRVSDATRKVVSGFDHGECVALQGDSTAQAVEWRAASIDDLDGKVLRLEFFIRNCDLYSFRATGG